jgi:hypothetical protein
MDRRYRVVGIALLLAGTAGVCVWYGATDRWAYPSPADIAADPAAYDGEEVLLFAEVTALDRSAGRLSVRAGPREFVVRGLDTGTLEGIERVAALQVHGRLGERSTVLVADRVVVDYRNGTDRAYVYAMSVLGGMLAAARFLRTWGVDPRRGRFFARGED